MDNISLLAKRLFFERTEDTKIQFFRYIFVGGVATIIDMGSLYVFTSMAGIHYLISAAIAFVFGVMANYLMSIVWVFKTTGNFKREITLFVIIGLGGLILNEIIIWLLVEKVSLYYMIAKAIAVVIVLVWNFGMRKKFVFAQ
jgi:putative flippase GtrA